MAKILEELADTTERASKTCQTLFSKLKEELQLHEKIEEWKVKLTVLKENIARW